MVFCEDCRIKKGYAKHPAWPYVGVLQYAKCEICWKRDEAHDVPRTYLRPEHLKTTNEKAVDIVQQDVFRLKCEELSIYNPRTQKIDETMTKQLNEVFAHRKDEVDWVATYELRLIARDGYTKSKEHLKSIGGLYE